MAAAPPSWRQWFPAGKTLVHPVPVGGLAPAQSKKVKVSSVLFTSDGKMSREMRRFGAASVGLQGPWTSWSTFHPSPLVVSMCRPKDREIKMRFLRRAAGLSLRGSDRHLEGAQCRAAEVGGSAFDLNASWAPLF